MLSNQNNLDKFDHTQNGSQCTHKINKNGRKDFEDYDSTYEDEEEANYLQFAEDCLDVEAMVKAAAVERQADLYSSNNISDSYLYESNNEIAVADELDLLTDEISDDLLQSLFANIFKLTPQHLKQKMNLFKQQKNLSIGLYSMIQFNELFQNFSLLRFMPILVRALVSAFTISSFTTNNVDSELKQRNISNLLKFMNVNFEKFDLKTNVNKDLCNNKHRNKDEEKISKNLPEETSKSNRERVRCNTKKNVPCLSEICLTKFIGIILHNC